MPFFGARLRPSCRMDAIFWSRRRRSAARAVGDAGDVHGPADVCPGPAVFDHLTQFARLAFVAYEPGLNTIAGMPILAEKSRLFLKLATVADSLCRGLHLAGVTFHGVPDCRFSRWLRSPRTHFRTQFRTHFCTQSAYPVSYPVSDSDCLSAGQAISDRPSHARRMSVVGCCRAVYGSIACRFAGDNRTAVSDRERQEAQ